MDEDFDKTEKEIWEQLGNVQTPNPSKEVKTRFYAMLDTFKKEEEAKSENKIKQWLAYFKDAFGYKPSNKWAYALSILMVGSFGGYLFGNMQSTSKKEMEFLSDQVQEMKQMMMLTMLENPTATERLKAVSFTQELQTVDDQVIEALMTTLNYDENENVRLVTLDALIELADNPKVRTGLVQSLLKQESPLVQVALADAMVKLQEKGSVKQMKELLQKDNLNSSVKSKIEKTILVLS